MLSALLAALFMGTSCDRPAPRGPTVTLYTSADAFLARPIAEEFTRRTGIEVSLVTDTEATKTTGLVQRLAAERDRPRADVWWSSEALGTAMLADMGLLDPTRSAHETEFQEGWPVRDAGGRWLGFAARARAIAFNTRRVRTDESPVRLRDLADPRWRGKVGLARPQFGTTRTHIAALVALHGEQPVREWLLALRENDARLYEGNSAVVQALALGEIEVGLTDTDDVWAGQANGWPVDLRLEAVDAQVPATGLPSAGALIIPNTVALIAGRPHPEPAQALVDFLTSADCERLLAAGDSHNVPIRPALAAELADSDPRLRFSVAAPVDWSRVAQAREAADRLIAQAFPIR